MGSVGQVRWRAVVDMLDHCAPGWRHDERDHFIRLYYDNRTYPNFPIGAHGRRANIEIQIGHVKKMVRFFDIEQCAGSQIAQLHIKPRK